jgi:hypothetical protein
VECGVSLCDSEVSKMNRPWPTKSCWAMYQQLLVSDLDVEPVVYDTNFEVKKIAIIY